MTTIQTPPTSTLTPTSTKSPLHPQDTALKKQAHRITSHPTLSPHRRRVYLALLSIPRGRWTTYSALAKHLHSSARAIGTAMRTNPFAPDVPCHRVLAADGSLGGYMGAGPASGSANLARKRTMLEDEGVEFEWVDRGTKSGWRARGECFIKFP